MQGGDGSSRLLLDAVREMCVRAPTAEGRPSRLRGVPGMEHLMCSHDARKTEVGAVNISSSFLGVHRRGQRFYCRWQGLGKAKTFYFKRRVISKRKKKVIAICFV